MIMRNISLASVLFALVLAAAGCAAHGQASVNEGGAATGTITDSQSRSKSVSGSESGSLSGSASGSITHTDRD